MKTYNSEIVKNTLINLFKQEKRILSKKDLVRMTRFPNRVVKEGVCALLDESYLRKEGTGYNLIKSPSRKHTVNKGEVQKACLEIFESLKDTNPELVMDDIFILIEGKYEKQQVYNAIANMTKMKIIERVSTGRYKLTEKASKHVMSTSHTGVTIDIREVLPIMNKKFKCEEVYKKLKGKYTRRQVSNNIKGLISTGELTRISQGYYMKLEPQDLKEPEEIDTMVVLKEKKEKDMLEKEIDVQDVLEESRTFVRLQTGLKNFDGDYALLIRIGSAIIKSLGWKKNDKVVMKWIPDAKRARVHLSDTGYVLSEGNDHVFTAAIPLPEGSGHKFPKPRTRHTQEKHYEVDVPMKYVIVRENKDLSFILDDLVNIDYV